MDVWLGQWKIPYRVVSVPRDGRAIRVCFSDDKFARAFQIKFGALAAPSDACATERASDPAKIDLHRLVEGNG